MNTWVEHLGERKQKVNGRPYRTFRLKIASESMMQTIKGCMYYIDTGTIQMPGFGKASLVTFDPVTHRILEDQVRESFLALGESHPTYTEEERKKIQKEVREKLKKPKTQEQWNTEYFARKDKEKKK